MTDEFLTRCVVDPLKRKFYLYSSEGEERTVDCETMEEFLNVLELVRDITPEDYDMLRRACRPRFPLL